MVKKMTHRYPEYASNLLYIITSNYPPAPGIAKQAKVVDMRVGGLACGGLAVFGVTDTGIMLLLANCRRRQCPYNTSGARGNLRIAWSSLRASQVRMAGVLVSLGLGAGLETVYRLVACAVAAIALNW